jgi:hypothetical protein
MAATLTALGQEWCAHRGWEDGELVWEKKAILFLTDAVLSIRQVRPQKLPRAEADARKRKMAAARQATRRCRLRQTQAERDAGGGGEGRGGRAGGRRGVGERPRRGSRSRSNNDGLDLLTLL